MEAYALLAGRHRDPDPALGPLAGIGVVLTAAAGIVCLDLVKLPSCPWVSEHTTGPQGAAVTIHPSGAFDFTCPHAHCGGRDWRDFRAAMEPR